MKLFPIDRAAFAAALPSPMPTFSAARHVQGCDVCSAQNVIKIVCGGRYKRFPTGEERIRIERGTGHFKWARGELAFSEGDCFCAQGVEEYELNGTGEFLVITQ